MKNTLKIQNNKKIFLFSLLIICFINTECTRNDEETYNPSGKCGSIMSSTISSGLPVVYNLKVNMDDGHIYNTVSSQPYNIGARVCF